MRALIALLLLAGCDQLFNLEHLPEVHDALPDAAPCVTTGVACSGTLTAFVCDTTCFVSCTTHQNWGNANTICTNAGAELAVLDTQPLDGCVSSHLSENSWMGLVQTPNQGDPAAMWSWLAAGTAEPLAYTDWRTNEPNDNGGGENNEENCAFVANAGGWIDYSCTATLAFVCQR